MTVLVLAAALVGSAGGCTSPGSPTPGDGVPDGNVSGSSTLEFRVVAQAVPFTGPGTAPGDPDAAARQSTDEAVQLQQLDLLDCSLPDPLRGRAVPAQPLVTCAVDASEKFVLDPTEFTGVDIAEATAARDQFGSSHVVQLRFTAAGATRWADLTAANVGQRIAFTLDGAVLSAPTVNEAITAGETVISGQFTADSAARLADQIMGR